MRIYAKEEEQDLTEGQSYTLHATRISSSLWLRDKVDSVFVYEMEHNKERY